MKYLDKYRAPSSLQYGFAILLGLSARSVLLLADLGGDRQWCPGQNFLQKPKNYHTNKLLEN